MRNILDKTPKQLQKEIHGKVRAILEAPDLETMVKLEESLGSIEKVLDEYLLSLQVDIDFDKYFTDKKSYNKLRKESF